MSPRFSCRELTYLLVLVILCWKFYNFSDHHVEIRGIIPNKFGLTEDFEPSYFIHPICKCEKSRIKHGPLYKLESTCSPEASQYGPHQKVISFSLFECDNNPQDIFEDFLYGIYPNLWQIRQLYPGWVVRIYSNINITEKYCDIACEPEVFWCDIRNSTVPDLNVTNPRVWRFVPLGDPTVDIFISRDIDSLIIEREQEIVSEWELTSDKPFHLARDSGSHQWRAMLAGIWGAKNTLLGFENAQEIRSELLKGALDNYDSLTDEVLLKNVIFNKYHDQILQHDSYLCDMYNGTSPFPKQRLNRVVRVAQSIRHIGQHIAPPCPVECRPSHGKDWTYC